MDQNPSMDKILRLPEVLAIVGIGRSTIFDSIRNGLFPKQLKLSERTIGWLESDIRNWLNSRRTTV